MKVSVQSLKNGLNFYEFDPEIAELDFEERNFMVKRVQVKSKVDRSEHNIVVTSEATASIESVCESCLKNYTDQFEDTYTILYTTEKEALEDDEMVQNLSTGTNQIDLTEGLRESILLALPMRFKCTEGCKGLCARCGANLDAEPCECKDAQADPRWEGLRKLLKEEVGDN